MTVPTAEPSVSADSAHSSEARDGVYDVFISYRRSGGSDLAQLIYGALTSRGYRVFLDVREMPPGEFDQSLANILAAARDVVVLLTEGCLDRCGEAEDWFREEISRALAGKANVVPFRTLGFAVPKAEALPPGIRALSGRHILSYSHEHSDASLDNLCRLLHARPRRRRPAALLPIAAFAGILLVAGGFGLCRHFLGTSPSGAEGGKGQAVLTPPPFVVTQPAVAPLVVTPAPPPAGAHLDVYQLREGARVPLQSGQGPIAPGTQLSLVPATSPGKQIYLLEINGQGHADLYDQQQLEQVHWGWQIDGPSASETLLLLSTDHALAPADRQKLTGSINQLNLAPRVAGQTQVVWENGTSRTLAGSEHSRGPVDVVKSDWQQQVLKVLHGVDGLSFNGVSVAVGE